MVCAMKKSIIIFGAFAALLAGCVKEASVSNDSTAPAMQEIKIVATVDNSDVKATWVDGEGLQWNSSADADQFQLGIIDATAYAMNTSSAVAVGGDKRATVTVTAPATFDAAYLFYPRGSAYNQEANDNLTGAWFNLSQNQTQAAAGTLESLTGKVVMSSTSAITAYGDTYGATMTCHTALARFLVFSSTGNSKSVKEISIDRHDGGNVWGQMHILHFKNGSTTEEWSGVGTSTNKVTLGTALSLSGITAKADAQGIYLGLKPGTYEGVTYTVKMTDDTEYIFFSSANKDFVAGTIHNIYLNLDKATLVEPSLTKDYSTEIDKDGETIASAATLALEINGVASANVAADLTTYGVSLTCTGGATASVTNAAGNVQIIFPANATGSPKDYTLTASWSGHESSITFTQAAGSGGGAPTYTYTLIKNVGWGDAAIIGETSGWDPNGVFWTIKNVELGGTPIDYSDDSVLEAVFAQVFQITDPGDAPAGYESRNWDSGAFGVHKVYANAVDGIGVSPIFYSSHPNCKARFAWSDEDGVEQGYVYFCSNP